MNVRDQALGVAMALCFLGGCGEEQAVGTTTKEFNEQRQALAAKLEKDKGRARVSPARVAAGAPLAAGFGDSSDFSYDAAGRRDPFRSYAWEHMKLDLAHSAESGPLEQYDLSQLALIGVVWDVGRARALVQDPSGMSYVVAAGARMGKNNGLVTRIDDNLLMVQERYVDLYGNESTKDVEMRIRPSDGG